MPQFSKWLLIFSVLLPTPAFAFSFEERCPEDQIGDRHMAHGRNAWSFRCGYVAAEGSVTALDAEGLYVTFSNGIAPSDPNAPCIPGLRRLGTCNLGCFAAGERLLFGGAMLPIEQAYARGVPTITTLQPGARPTQLLFAEQPLQSFVRGASSSALVVIRVADGKAVRVTTNHPMVDEAGRIVRADRLTVGQKLLTRDGPRAIVALESAPYVGEVWNVKPASTAAAANVNIAEGFVTGSVRFQNQWADDADRLIRRMTIDVDQL